jgi:methylenetetrahydrofolate dehydrogenase (NADP+)/methenyltetrahydrofolate cyclohydrolase
MTLIDGKAIAARIQEENRAAVAELAHAESHRPRVVLVGENPASRAYVRSKDKMCQELGMHSVKHELPAAITQAELIELVQQLNATRRSTASSFNRRRPSTSASATWWTRSTR